MDKNKAHDVLHVWNGNKTENCPVCCGTLKDDAEIVNAAQEIAAQNYYPRINPTLSMEQSILCDEDGKPQQQDAAKESHVEKTGTVNVMTDVMSFSEDKKTVPSRIKVVPVGKYKTQAYGEIEITKQKLLDMKRNYESGIRAGGTQTGLPIDVEHGTTIHKDKAAGWMKNIDVQDDGAYADVEWTPLGKELLETGEYKFYSPEFHFEYLDPEHSFTIDNVMTGGGLVNKPMFKHDLPPIVMHESGNVENLTSEIPNLMLYISNQSSAEVPTNSQSNAPLEFSEKEEKPMDLQNILTKEKSARTSEEAAFVYANMAQLTDDQKVAEGFVATPAVETNLEPADAPAETKVEEKVEPVAPAAPVTASENGGITISPDRLKALEESAKRGEMAFSELQKSQAQLEKINLTEKVKGFVFNEKGGKIAPAQVDPMVSLMLTMSEDQRNAFTAIIESLPDKQVFGEQGTDHDLDKSQAADILTAKAHDLVKTSKDQGVTLTFGEALKKVSNENPELYMESLKVKNG